MKGEEAAQTSGRGRTALKIGAWLWIVIAGLLTVGTATAGMVIPSICLALSALLVAPPLTKTFSRYGLADSGRRGVAMLAGGAGLIGLTIMTEPPAPAAKPVAAQTALASTALKPAVDPAIQANALAKTAVQNAWSQVMSAAGPCDTANSSTAELLTAVGQGDASVYDAYAAARGAKEACNESWLKMGKINAPSTLSADHRRDLAKAIERCETGYSMRNESLDTLMTFLDGDQRPSIVEQYKEQAGAGHQAGILLCVAELAALGSKVGADLG